MIKTATASVKSMRVSTRKLGLVASAIRGKTIAQAFTFLDFSRKRIAKKVKKCLLSAVANAENNIGLNIGSLVLSRVEVGKSMIMKRSRARAKGRGAMIRKPFSCFTIVLEEV